MTVQFAKLRPEFLSDVDQVLDIYREAFPPNERQPIDVLLNRIIAGKSIVYTGKINDEIVFEAMLWPLTGTNFILLDYMATKSNYRGKGIASAFLTHMRDDLQQDEKFFIMEIEDPSTGHNIKERQQRVAFYRTNGARQIMDLRYILPSLDNTVSTEMILMIFPEYHLDRIDGNEMKNIVKQVYKELYNKDEDSEYVRSLNNYPDKFDLV